MIKMYICLLIFSSFPLFAQQSKLSFEICEVTRLIADSPNFIPLSNFNDVFLLDTIFEYSLSACKNDTGEALLCASLSALPYNQIPIQTPFTGIRLLIPIYSAEKEIFERKNSKLPKFLSIDSPLDNYGDKDKTAHFFGAAFLAYSTNSVELSEYIGYFVEIIESILKVDPIDERDVKMNSSGAAFGRLSRKNNNIKPSEVLMFSMIINVKAKI